MFTSQVSLCETSARGRPRTGVPAGHVVKNEEEVMKSPNIPTVLTRASPGADLPRGLLPMLLGGERDHEWHGSNRGARGYLGSVPSGQRVTAVVRLQ